MARSSAGGGRSGRGGGKSSSLTSGTTTTSGDFLSNLSLLREFIKGCGCGHQFTETDLSACLRRSGLNVEVAAEHLLTGQWKAGSAGGNAGVLEASDPSSAAASSSSTAAGASSSITKAGGGGSRRRVTPSPPESTKRRRVNQSLSSSSSASSAASASASANKSTGKDGQQRHLLLCRRWMVGLSTTPRGGRVRHSENLVLSCSSSGPPIVRFRGHAVQGTLPQEECSMLTPLLRHDCNAGGGGDGRPLISITAEALMEDMGLVIGSEVPLSLSIYIEEPLEFFDLFSIGDDASASTAASSFYPKNMSKKKRLLPPVATEAFRLLQWAQYGNVPVFKVEKESDGEDNTSNDDDDDQDGSSQPSQQQSLTAVVDEEQFSQPDVEEAPEWADSILGGSSSTSSASDSQQQSPPKLPEEADPAGLQSGIKLRPYQRQALYWMLHREDDSPDHADLTKELELLSELAANSSSTSPRGGSGAASISQFANSSDQSKHVVCECGPVLVSDEAASMSTTIHGDTDPIRHPLWQRRFLATEGCENNASSVVICFYVNEVLGVASAAPPNPPRQCVGGILADSMGLGKTVMLLSLIMKSKEKAKGCADAEGTISNGDDLSANNKKRKASVETIDLSSEDDNDDENDEDYTPTNEGRVKKSLLSSKGTANGTGTTIVVAPLSLIAQWEEEVASKTTLSCRVHYGETRSGASSNAFDGVDVVLTTYGTIQGEYLQSSSSSSSSTSKASAAKGSKSTPLLSYAWERVILDESHCIKNPKTAVAKACGAIAAAKRWAVTGTPIQNSLQDVYGLMKFLKHEPWCNKALWNKAITSASSTTTSSDMATDEDAMKVSMDRVRRLLHPLILRRTKETLGEDGNPILSLPPVDSSVVYVTLTQPERDFYTALLDKSQTVFEGLIKAGTASRSWLAIFSLLQRLRQSCDHVALTIKPRFTDDSSAESPAIIQGKDSANADATESAVNKNFLSGLLQMFASSTTSTTNRTSESKDRSSTSSSPSNKNSRSSPDNNETSTTFITQVAKSLTESVNDGGKIKDECTLCLECPDITSAVLTPCAHVFCLDCIRPVLNQSAQKDKSSSCSRSCKNAFNIDDGSCPVCNASIIASNIVTFTRSSSGDITSQFVADVSIPESDMNDFDSPSLPMDPTAASARETLLASMSGGASSKLAAIRRELDEVWKLDGGSKVLIFSQYLGFLDLLGICLQREGIPYFRLDGQMSLKERVNALERFNKAKSVPGSKSEGGGEDKEEVVKGSVFLASMKAGGVGINLVAASSVFIVDPWWNAAVEDQCINRIHRIGQKAPIVRVRRFVVTDSVEEKIVNLQQRKKSMANDILDGDTECGDLAANSKPTLEDFKILLGG